MLSLIKNRHLVYCLFAMVVLGILAPAIVSGKEPDSIALHIPGRWGMSFAELQQELVKRNISFFQQAQHENLTIHLTEEPGVLLNALEYYCTEAGLEQVNERYIAQADTRLVFDSQTEYVCERVLTYLLTPEFKSLTKSFDYHDNNPFAYSSVAYNDQGFVWLQVFWENSSLTVVVAQHYSFATPLGRRVWNGSIVHHFDVQPR